MDNDLLNEIIKICLVAIAAQVIPGLFLLGRLLIRQATLKLEQSQYGFIVDICHRAVLLAEQLGIDGELAAEGDEKLQWAVDYAQAELGRRGIGIELEPLVSILKSAVLDEFNREKVSASLKGE